MELKQFINKLLTQPGLHSQLPVNQGMLYPCFDIRDGKLIAHFLTNASAITPEGMVQQMPLYHITALYPHGAVLGVENLKFNPCYADVDFTASTLIPKRTAEEKLLARQRMEELTKLVNEVLESWEATGTAAPAAYHEQLNTVLLPEQKALYQRVMGW